jgi:hypothetical protein
MTCATQERRYFGSRIAIQDPERSVTRLYQAQKFPCKLLLSMNASNYAFWIFYRRSMYSNVCATVMEF